MTRLWQLLGFCQFSDYARIMCDNWPLLSDVFGEGKSFDQHIAAVTTARNAFALNNPIGKAGLIWVEECLRKLEQSQLAEAEAVTNCSVVGGGMRRGIGGTRVCEVKRGAIIAPARSIRFARSPEYSSHTA